jgi:hypothetical protein
MTDEPITHETPEHTALQAPQTDAYEPVSEEEEWLEEPVELPRRPRRRLLTPVPLALLGVLLVACGFIGGVLVEKGQSTSGSAAGAAGSLASRFAALRSGSSATGAGARSGGAAASGAGGLFGGGGRTAGQVAYLAGGTLYVTTAEGNTVKIATSAGTTVTKTVSSAVKDIHPGETVTITGTSGKGGAVSAESISVGSSGSGLAALFGGGAASGSKSSSSSSSSGPALFGGG